MRSAVEPDSMSRLASTSTYASIVHCKPDTDACKSARIAASATFTIVTSMETISRLRQQIGHVE